MRNNRRNHGGGSARGGSGKGDAAKLLPLIVLAVCVIGVVAFFICKHGKTGGDGPEKTL